jgi:hypothetical protein
MDIATQEIQELNKQLQLMDTQYEPPVNHYFKDGMYCRETFTHAGTMLIGATHKQATFNILTEGEVTVSNGDKVVYLKAPQIFISEAGSQKVAYCITDTIMVNVFRTDAKTPDEAEQELFKEEIYKETQCQQQLQ